MKLFVVMAHWDPEGRVAPHVRRHILALREVAERVVVVSTADLLDEDAAWLEQTVELRRRANYGYDFFSYRTGLVENELDDYTHVVMCNDTFVGPLVDYARIFATMDASSHDFWGFTRSDLVAPHTQSFFVCFRSWVVASRAFRRFWLEMVPLSDRWTVIQRYEIGLTKALHEAGFDWGSYYNETADDARVAKRRMLWRAALKAKQAPKGKRRAVFERHRNEAWNPNAALADRALRGGALPIIKIDTLRYDPYRLGSTRLLRASARKHPELFGDVEEYLRRTDRFYPHRKADILPDPGIGRAVYPLVRYV